jgi:hypothetical protein
MKLHRTNRKLLKGFSLIELSVAAVASVIVILGVTMIMADGQKGYNRIYDRAFSGLAREAYVVRSDFDSIVRKACNNKVLIANDGSWLEIYYYESDESATVDRYAKLFYDQGDSELNVEYGQLNPKATVSIKKMCGNVTACEFKIDGQSAQMILTLDNGLQSMTVANSSFLHNY